MRSRAFAPVKLDLFYVPLSEEMIKQARMDESNIIKQKGGTLWDMDCVWSEHNPEEDFIGSLAQQAVSSKFREWGFEPDETPFYDTAINKDQYDFRWRFENLDVKGSPTDEGWDDVYPNSRFLQPNGKMNLHMGKIDRYIFVKVNLRKRVAIIAGLIQVPKFWRTAKCCTEAGMKTKTPSHYVTAKELSSFRNFVFGV